MISGWLQPVKLHGKLIRLEPLAQSHAQGLYIRGCQAADWAYMPRRCFIDQADTRHWVEEALCEPASLPFAIVENNKSKVVGSTRFLNVREEHRGLEIGWTWLGSEWQRTGINTEAKYLLMKHAFERLGCMRVEFKTDARNLRSQAALERIGACREGVRRQHMVVQEGFLRDSVYFSVLDHEWPRVRGHLCELMAP